MARRLALCVGINDYPGTGADLAGCVNDGRDWNLALLARGYEAWVLLDEEATALNVVAALTRLLDSARFGDRVVFAFSGHGTWVPDADGDEADFRDEALCCHDFLSGGLITDDELHAVLSQRRVGVRVTIISDSCHSGTMARGPAVGRRGGGKFLPPPNLPVGVVAEIEERTQARSAPRSGAVLISGCADHEFSYDASFDGRPNGAMSRRLLDALDGDSVGASGGSVRAVFSRLREYLPSAEYPQTPQLTASAYQRRTSLL